jgi:Bacterial surface proteins containing Ig-like domains
MALTYKVYLNGKFSKEVENLSTLLEGLVKDTEYSIQVSETDGETESSLSEAIKLTTTVIPETSISLDKTSATVPLTGNLQLIPMILPTDATYKDVTWTSSDASIVKVNERGLVTAIGLGEAQIKAETKNGKTASCSLTVNSVIIIPTTSNVKGAAINSDSIGIETAGLDTGESFGGTTPESIEILSITKNGETTLLEMPKEWTIDRIVAEEIGSNKYLVTNENKSIEITTEEEK